jgi:hypothetical protein
MRLLLWPLPSSTTNLSTNSPQREVVERSIEREIRPNLPGNVFEITTLLLPPFSR